ncbi:MAG: alpha-L-fucosidase [Alistipes indistinctus]
MAAALPAAGDAFRRILLRSGATGTIPTAVELAPRGRGRSNDWDYPNERAKEFSRYFERKAMPQVLELLRQYPNISILWFDTPGYCSPEQSQRMIDTIQKYRPGCLINDRVGNGLGDFITPEQTVSGGLDPRSVESCITIGSSWGYLKRDTVFKSPEIVARLLTDIVSKGGNLLLNIGPTPWGTFPEKAVANSRCGGPLARHQRRGGVRHPSVAGLRREFRAREDRRQDRCRESRRGEGRDGQGHRTGHPFYEEG